MSVKRDDLLKQAEDILAKMNGGSSGTAASSSSGNSGHSRALLEVGFDGEVGTGYGPTLEFYSSVSRELHRYALRLWTGDKIEAPAEHSGILRLLVSILVIVIELFTFPRWFPGRICAIQGRLVSDPFADHWRRPPTGGKAKEI